MLVSAPDAGISAGARWFGALLAAARAAVPAAHCTALLDCGDDAGAAQAAIRAGIDGVIFTGHCDVAERLADIAGQQGVTLVTARPILALDLGAQFFATPEFLRRHIADVLASLPPV